MRMNSFIRRVRTSASGFRWGAYGSGGRRRHLLASAAFIGILLAVTLGSPVYAADPNSTGAYTGTGVAVGSGGSAVSVPTGIPAGYAERKASQFAEFAAGRPASQPIVRPVKRGVGATGSGTTTPPGIQPAVSCPVGGYPCYFTIVTWFPSLHQMRTYYCVVAFVQTVAYWDLGSSFLTMGTGSQLGGQDWLYNNALYGGDHGPGVWDPNALNWINSQFSSRGYGFYYLPVLPGDTPSFMSYVRFDMYYYHPDAETNYVRVALSSGEYGGWTSGGLHATGTEGYSDNTGTVLSYDPYDTRNSDGTCTQSISYSYSQTSGCYWNMPQSNYFYAMDTGSNGTLPLWY
jgi:hypothetical protein